MVGVLALDGEALVTALSQVNGKIWNQYLGGGCKCRISPPSSAIVRKMGGTDLRC
jgi:hypothetical protein